MRQPRKRRILRLAWRAAAAAAAAAALLTAGALLWREAQQHRSARALAIRSPGGIDVGAFVPVGGIPQWVHVRGEDRANPVVLILHGGPGGSLSALVPVFREWEEHFSVVQWDQRGAGKTYARGGEGGQGEMTIDRMTADGIEVVEYLRGLLGQPKVVIVGLSWGSVIGVRMAALRPDLLSAYVGTGQVVDKDEKETLIFADLLGRAKAAGDAEAIAALEAIGPPPYRSYDDLLTQRRWSLRYDVASERELESHMRPLALASPYHSLRDLLGMLAAPRYAGRRMHAETNGYDARALGTRFEVPLFVITGDRDAITPAELARHWLDEVEAPFKEFVVLEGGGHAALLTMPGAFLRELVARVRPFALAGARPAPQPPGGR